MRPIATWIARKIKHILTCLIFGSIGTYIKTGRLFRLCRRRYIQEPFLQFTVGSGIAATAIIILIEVYVHKSKIEATMNVANARSLAYVILIICFVYVLIYCTADIITVNSFLGLPAAFFFYIYFGINLHLFAELKSNSALKIGFFF